MNELTTTFRIESPPAWLEIGYDAENNWRTITINCEYWFNIESNGTVVLMYKPACSKPAYPLKTERSGNSIVWTPESAELVAGVGTMQAFFEVDGTTIGASKKIPCEVDGSLLGSASGGTPPWAIDVIEEIKTLTGHYPYVSDGKLYVWDSVTEQWVEFTSHGGGSAVDSVNGKTGDVVLDASDVGALPDSYTPPVVSVNGKTGAVNLGASDVGAYVKPSGGIPKIDLAAAVQTSLGKADTALQEHQSLSGYATETYVQQQIAAIPDELPSVSASDNGKVLGVVNGAWAAKADEGGGGGGSVTVDSALSGTSTNPVQNKVVKAALDTKADASALAAKQDTLAAGQNVTISGNTISADVDSAEIASKVTNWLDANVDPVGSAVVVDSSLTVRGAAADSKTVGDVLGAGEYALGDPDNWVRQIILDGERQSSETRITTKNYLPANVTHIVCASGYSALIHRYTLNGEYAGFWGGSSFVTTGSGIYRQEFDIPQDSYRYVLVFKKNDNATITTDAAVNITSDADGESTEGLIQRVSALESSNVYKAVDDFESGAFWTVNGALTAEYEMYAKYRRQVHMLKIGTAPVKISVGSTDAALVQTVSGYFYDSAFALLERQSGNTLSADGTLLLTPPTGAKYLKYTFVLTADSNKKIKSVEFSSSVPLRVVKNANIPHPSYGNMFFDYPVGKSHRTSGQLILPPNYTVDGNPVPLYVQVHGTGAMSKWGTRLGINGSTDSRYLSQYMANEGFAVFDCYPWTDKYYSTSDQISPYILSIHQKAYIDGIRYVCDRFNVDINNVCMSFKSLGGHLGYWFMSEAELPVKAIAMLAPSAVWWAMFWDEYFYSTPATRTSIVSALGLTGKPNADAFIQYGKMANANARAFVEDNLIAFASVAPAACDTHGATYQEFYDWMVTRATAKPQWMVDLGLPDFPSNRSVPQLIEHPELTKHSLYPVKYWMAWDDINTSTHVAYTVYQWLKNSGSDAQWETVPNGTGAHHAIDTDPNAEKLSGTTRLGIAYSGIAKTYVQMADFFYDKM